MKKIILLLLATLCALSITEAQKTKVVGWGNNSNGQLNLPAGLVSVVGVAAAVTFILWLYWQMVW